MNTGRLVSKAVVHINNQAVTEIHINLGTGPLAIDPNHWTLKSIGGSVDPSDIPLQMDILGQPQFGGPCRQQN